MQLSMRKGRCGRKIILIVIFVGRWFEFPSHSSQQNRLKDELQKMQYLYNDHISGVKIEVQKLYSIKATILSLLKLGRPRWHHDGKRVVCP